MIEDEPQFKQNLYQAFKETGMVDNLKAQMRFKLIDKLQKQAPLKQGQIMNEKDQLRKRIAVSLIAEFFELKQYNYTNSVFLPESGYQNSLLSRPEIFEILKFRDVNILHDKNALFEQIIDMFLGKLEKQVVKASSSTQTEYGDSIMNLENKLNLIDLQWRQKMAKDLLPNQQSVEERMNKWKKEYEQRMKADMQAELTRIRQFELSNLRLEEQEKAQFEMQEYREDLEKKFQEKLNKLRDRERETLDKCAQKMKDLEQYNHEHRQKIIKDFELLKLREDELEKGKKLNDEKLNVEKIRLETLQKELKNKIKELDDQRLQSERKTETDKQMAKLEVYKEVQQEQLEYIQKKKAVEEDMLKINQIKDSLNQFKSQNKLITEENSALVDRNQELNKKKTELENDLRLVRDNLQTVNESYRREQGNVKNIQEKLRLREEEIDFLKKALADKDDISGQHKQQSLEQIKKFNNEVSTYQYKIDKLENELKLLRKEQIENEDIIKRGFGGGGGAPIISHKYPVDDLNVSKMQQSFAQRLTGMQSEHQMYREQRKRAIQELMMDHDDFDKKNYNMKFGDVYDITGSQVDLQQIQRSQSRPLQPSQQEAQISAYQPPQDIYQPPQLHQQQYQSPLDKMDVAQSQVVSEMKKQNMRININQTRFIIIIIYEPSQDQDEYSQHFESSYGQSYGHPKDQKSKGREIFEAPKQVNQKKEEPKGFQKMNLSPISEDIQPSFKRPLEPKIEEKKQLDSLRKSPASGGGRGMFGQLRSMSNQRKDEDEFPSETIEDPKKDVFDIPKMGSGNKFGSGQKFDPLGKKDDFSKSPGGLKNPFPSKNLQSIDKKAPIAEYDDDFLPKKQTNLPSLQPLNKQKQSDLPTLQPLNQQKQPDIPKQKQPEPERQPQQAKLTVPDKKDQYDQSYSQDFMEEPVEDFEFEEIDDDDMLPL